MIHSFEQLNEKIQSVLKSAVFLNKTTDYSEKSIDLKILLNFIEENEKQLHADYIKKIRQHFSETINNNTL